MRNRPAADVYSYIACKLSDICQKKQITNIISTPVYDAIQTGTDEVLKGNLKAALAIWP